MIARLLTERDVYHFREGTHFRVYEKLGAHPVGSDGRDAAGDAGTYFGVWAPNAARVSVVGDFNGWNPRSHALDATTDESGLWTGFVPGIGAGARYKFQIESRHNGYTVQKSDPFAFRCEEPPRTASVVADLAYEWHDGTWMNERAGRNATRCADVHLRGSSRLVAARSGGGQSSAQLPRARSRARRLRE